MTTKVKLILGGIGFCFLLYLFSGPSESDKRAEELSQVNSALAANRYKQQEFNSGAANFNRAAEGFAKGFEGDIPGIARDMKNTVAQQHQLNEDARQLQAYRANLTKNNDSGGTFASIVGFIVLICIAFGIYDRFKPASKSLSRPPPRL